MINKLFVFRHAETTDNARQIFSGWRNPTLTAKGVQQAHEVAAQLRSESIQYAFTSHLRRARMTLAIVLQAHPGVPVFVDDRLIERCYGVLQGRSKRRVAKEDPEGYATIHRGYETAPLDGESLQMVEARTLPFLQQLKAWLQVTPGNVAISCHGNSMRPIRRVFEHLSLRQMLQIESPQDEAFAYTLHCHGVQIPAARSHGSVAEWQGVRMPTRVKLAMDPRNPLQKYY